MQKTILKIEGMMCGMCEVHISDCVRHSFPVRKVSTSRKSGECVIISDDPLSIDKLKKMMEDTGYTLASIEQMPYEKKPSLFGR